MSNIIDLNQIPEHIVDAWLDRTALVESLLDNSISYQEKKDLRREFMEKYNVGKRTIRKYKSDYKENGPAALLLYKPKVPKERIQDKALQEKILSLIDERPTRTVRQLRYLLIQQEEYKEAISNISDRTIYRFLWEKGFTKRKRYAMACESSRLSYHRFEAEHSLALVQGDARDGIWITLPDGRKKKTYLFVWIDDYSRKILYAEYYWDEKLPRMEDSFKKMVLRWGIPLKIYLDNGHVYSSKHFAWLLVQLGIKKIHHKPYAAYCKGKVESWNKTVKYEFQQEAALAGISSLEELNTALWAWIEVVYNVRVHSSTGQAPNKRFQDGLPEKIERVKDIQWFNALFYMRQNRTITKYGKIKLFGNQYGIKDIPYNTVVEVRYNPFDLQQAYVFTGNKYNQTVVPSKLKNQVAPSVPEENKKPASRVSGESRNYFQALREQHRKIKGEKNIRYSELNKEENNE